MDSIAYFIPWVPYDLRGGYWWLFTSDPEIPRGYNVEQGGFRVIGIMTNPALYIYTFYHILDTWRFPEMVVPKILKIFFHYRPSILIAPQFMENPILGSATHVNSNQHSSIKQWCLAVTAQSSYCPLIIQHSNGTFAIYT